MTVLYNTFSQATTSRTRPSLFATLAVGLLVSVSGLIPTAFVLLAM